MAGVERLLTFHDTSKLKKNYIRSCRKKSRLPIMSKLFDNAIAADKFGFGLPFKLKRHNWPCFFTILKSYLDNLVAVLMLKSMMCKLNGFL